MQHRSWADAQMALIGNMDLDVHSAVKAVVWVPPCRRHAAGVSVAARGGGSWQARPLARREYPEDRHPSRASEDLNPLREGLGGHPKRARVFQSSQARDLSDALHFGEQDLHDQRQVEGIDRRPRPFVRLGLLIPRLPVEHGSITVFGSVAASRRIVSCIGAVHADPQPRHFQDHVQSRGTGGHVAIYFSRAARPRQRRVQVQLQKPFHVAQKALQKLEVQHQIEMDVQPFEEDAHGHTRVLARWHIVVAQPPCTIQVHGRAKDRQRLWHCIHADEGVELEWFQHLNWLGFPAVVHRIHPDLSHLQLHSKWLQQQGVVGLHVSDVGVVDGLARESRDAVVGPLLPNEAIIKKPGQVVGKVLR
eukprot:scaffold79_cov259-Pinguiococcus_pyrenoidosus.AAC.28